MMDCGFLEFTKIRDSNLVLILDSSDSTKNNLNLNRGLKRERDEKQMNHSFLALGHSLAGNTVQTCI